MRLFLFLITASLSSVSAFPQDVMDRFNREMLARHSRILENNGNDGNDGQMQCDFDMDDGFQMQCDVCYQSGMCISESCTSYDMTYLDCITCITDGDGNNAAFDTYCMETNCDMNTYLDEGATMEEACTCEGVVIDEVACQSCSICPNDGVDYDLAVTAVSGGSLNGGVALKCPYNEAFNSQCPVKESGAKKTALIILPLVAIAAAFGAFFIWKKKGAAQDSKKVNLVKEKQEGITASLSAEKKTMSFS